MASRSRRRNRAPGRAARAAPNDERYMRMALGLARAQLGLTAPNPAVGCVIVRDGRIVGRGATAAGGRPHAEALALAQAGARASGAAVYVSLEPCAHRGQTPSCAKALVDAGVARVAAGCLDPYPPVRGRGLAILRRAGIDVVAGVCEDECRRMNEGFITRVTRGRPFVTLKLAMTLDGRIAAAGGDSRWISSEESRAIVHRWRREADVVMVGAATVAADNPRLNCRIEGGRDPARVVVDGRLRVSPAANVFHLRSAAPTILATTAANLARARRRYRAGAAGPELDFIGLPAAGGRIDLAALMRELGRRGYARALLEGGAHLAGAALAAGVVDRVAFFAAPKILGAGTPAVAGPDVRRVADAVELAGLRATPVGGDLLIEAEVAPRKGRRSR